MSEQGALVFFYITVFFFSKEHKNFFMCSHQKREPSNKNVTFERVKINSDILTEFLTKGLIMIIAV